MGIFTIQTPDGRKIKIDAVDQQTALRGAQEYVDQNPIGQTTEQPGDLSANQSTGAQTFGDIASQKSQNFFKRDQIPVNPATATEATLAGLVNGIPILGPLAQSATDNLMGLGAQLTGGDYGQTVQGLQSRRKSLAEDLPVSSIAGNIGGAVAPFAAAAKAGQVATDALGMTGSLGQQALNGFLSTGGITAADNIARGQKPTDAVANAIVPSLVGGAIPVVGRGVEETASAIWRKAQPIVGAVGNYGDEALRRVGNAFGRDKEAGQLLSQSEQQAAALNSVPIVNADKGGETVRALTRSVSNQNPEARGAIEKLAGDRFEGQAGRAVDFIKRITDGAVDDLGAQASIKKAAAAANDPLYKAAFSDPKAGAVWTRDIADLMQSDAFRQAVKIAESRGSNRAAVDGFKAVKNPFAFTEDGAYTLKTNPDGSRALPSLQFWNQVKINLGDMENAAIRQGENSLAGEIKAMRQKLVGSLDIKVPSYASARQSAAAYFGADDALEAGRKYASSTNVVPEATQAFQALKPAEKEAFRVGYASELIGKIKEPRFRTNVINNVFGSPAKRELFEVVFGPAKARELEAYVRVEEAADKLRGALGNSTTARQLVELGIGAGAGFAISGNDWKGALTGAALTKGARYLGTKADDKVMQEVAKLLLSGSDRDLQKAVTQASLSPLWMSTLKKIADTIGGGARGAAVAIPAMQGQEMANAGS